MAYTTINKHTDYFNNILWTGNSGTQSITGVGFQPDWIWIKVRADNNNTGETASVITDAVRGNTKFIQSSSSGAEQTASNTVTSFDSDGFSVGNQAKVNSNSNTYVAWNWKAGGGQGSSNTDGSINTTYTSVNTTAGFSISSYTGTGSTATVGHGLGIVPKMIIIKKLNAAKDWRIYHASVGNTKQLFLNDTGGADTDSTIWNNTSPTSSVFTIGTNGGANDSASNYVAYCFAEKTGYSKFGSYTGNGNTDGRFVYTGFKPAWIMGKRTDDTNNWYMFDGTRNPSNVTDKKLRADTTAVENVDSAKTIDILSNGFKIRSSDAEFNASSGTYVFMAFGQSIVGTNNIPTTAR